MSNIVMFKSQLQEYAQKASMPMPVYETTREGPPHSPNFKAAVIVNGARYDSPSNFCNLKAAEHAAAHVALEDLLEKTNGQELAPNPVHDTGLCKNLLQEYAQKMSLPLPSYCCKRSGKIHLPTFTCTVEVSGVQYTGGVAHSKKEAEIKAARTALLALKAQACDSDNEDAVPNISSSEAAVSNNLTSQLEFSPRKRDREVEMSSEEQETVKSKKKTNSRNSTFKDEMSKENNSRNAENSQALSIVEDSQFAPLKELEKNSQQVSSEMQQDQDQVEWEVAIQAKEEGSEKLKDEQQIPQEVDLKKKKKRRKGAKGASKSKKQRKKKTQNGGQQKNLSTAEATHS